MLTGSQNNGSRKSGGRAAAAELGTGAGNCSRETKMDTTTHSGESPQNAAHATTEAIEGPARQGRDERTEPKEEIEQIQRSCAACVVQIRYQRLCCSNQRAAAQSRANARAAIVTNVSAQ